MNNEQNYSVFISFNWNPSNEFVLPNSTKNRTFLNQKFWINITYKLDVKLRFHDDTRIANKIYFHKYFKIVVVYYSDLDVLFLNMNILVWRSSNFSYKWFFIRYVIRTTENELYNIPNEGYFHLC